MICDECGYDVAELHTCEMCGWHMCDACNEDHELACDEAEKEEEKFNV